MFDLSVYLDPQPGLSRAMDRVSNALKRYAPNNVLIVDKPDIADIQVLHVIGSGHHAKEYLTSDIYVQIQYCYGTARPPNIEHLKRMWGESIFVWTYLSAVVSACNDVAHVYHSPLGIDDAFKQSPYITKDGYRERDIGIVTSGYVDGPRAEEISKVHKAARTVGANGIHIGPSIGLFPSVEDITDEELATYYRRSRRVSGLRYEEGFELPVIEGLACGCRPIVFNYPDMYRWYGDYAEFVDENGNIEEQLVEILCRDPEPLTSYEHESVLRTFDWQTICEGFWSTLLARI